MCFPLRFHNLHRLKGFCVYQCFMGILNNHPILTPLIALWLVPVE